MGERPTTRAGVARRASRMPGTPRIVPTDTTGLDGGTMTTSASAIASSTPGAGDGVLQPDHQHRLGGHLGVQPHPVLLEVHDPPAARRLGVGDRDVRLHPVVAHGQQPNPGLPAPAERLGHRGEGVARLQHPGAHQVGGDVPVAEAEPRRLAAVRRELLLDAPGLRAAAPPAVGVDAVAEGVHHGVQVGADLEPVQPQVVGGVGDHGDVEAADPGGRPEQTLEESGPPDAAGQDGERARGHGATLPHGPEVVQTGRTGGRSYQNRS